MSSLDLAHELLDSMREAAAIAAGEQEPAAQQSFLLPLDEDVRRIPEA